MKQGCIRRNSQGTSSCSDSISESEHSYWSDRNEEPYYRGGGYCSDAGKSYQERWSHDNLSFVLSSWGTRIRPERLLEMKERVRDVDHLLMNDPHFLASVLEDDKGVSVDEAEKWFRKVAQTRQESPFQHDTLCEDCVLPDDYDYFPQCVLEGCDREGDPITLTRVGAADILGLYQRHGRDVTIRHALYYRELEVRGAWVDDYEAKWGKKVTGYTRIYDLQGLNIRHANLGLVSVLKFVSRLVQDSYPEPDKRFLVIRAPAIFPYIWGMVKHFFDPKMHDLMHFASGDASSRELLAQYIDPDMLPTCVHSEGRDGRMAKGYEHIILEGGRLPPEGTYKTPRHIRRLPTSFGSSEVEDSDIWLHRAIEREVGLSRKGGESGLISCNVKSLLGGSYNPTRPDNNDDHMNPTVLWCAPLNGCGLT